MTDAKTVTTTEHVADDSVEPNKDSVVVKTTTTFSDFDIDKDGDVDIQDVKSIYKSKTVWVNVIALVAILLQQKFGFVIDESVQMQLLTVINIALRMITKSEVKW